MEPNRLEDASAPNAIGSLGLDAPPSRKKAPSYRAQAIVVIGVLLVISGVWTIIQGVDPDRVETSSLGVAFGWLGLGLGALLAFVAGWYIGIDGSIVWRAIGTAGGVGHAAWLVFGLTQGVPPYLIGLVAIPFGVSLLLLVSGSANEVP